TTHAKGTPGPDLCSQFGDLTTTEYRNVSTISGGSSTISELKPTGGSLGGSITRTVKTTLADNVVGCQFVLGDPPVIPCSFTAPTQTLQASVGIDIEPSRTSAVQVREYWEIQRVSLDAARVSDVSCGR